MDYKTTHSYQQNNLLRNNTMELILNDNEKLSLLLDEPYGAITAWDEASMFFVSSSDQFLLTKDSAGEQAFKLKTALTLCLNNLKPLHSSIAQDVGYLWNEELAEKPGLSYYQKEGLDYWVGLKNLLWCTPSSTKPAFATWLYNSPAGEIIIEVTPTYPWHFRESDEDEKDYIPYEEFMKHYKPFIIRTIPKDVAHTWLVQAQELLDVIEKNTQRELELHSNAKT